MYCVAPASRAKVVYRSDTWMMSPTTWGSMTPGHQAKAGVRTPPSVKSPLPPRYSMGSIPQPGGGLWTMGPLSAMATNRVFSAMPRAFSSSITWPTNASTAGKAPATFIPATERFGASGFRKLRKLGQ